MLVELAAINAAMATIKTTIAHGKDIASAGTAIAKLINGEEELRERANAKQNSIFSKLLGNSFAVPMITCVLDLRNSSLETGPHGVPYDAIVSIGRKRQLSYL